MRPRSRPCALWLDGERWEAVETFQYLSAMAKAGWAGVDPDKLTDQINEVAAEGWRLVATVPNPDMFSVLIFERPAK